MKVGSSGLQVGAFQAIMRKRYPSYAKAADGNPLKVDQYFGYDDQGVAKEWQSRSGFAADGVLTDKQLQLLGVLPTLFSIHGTGQPDPFGIGYPADIARRCLDLYYWQPVGNWPAQAVPMNHSVDAGVAETYRLITDPYLTPGDFAFVDYSQGSIIGGRIRNAIRAGTDPRLPKLARLMGNASFGNPMRPKGSYAGATDPGGKGIDPTLETAVEPGTLNLAQRGDLYTTCPDGKTGEIEHAIFKMVFEQFTGHDSITEELWQLFTNPMESMPGIVGAIINGGAFILQNPPTKPHVTYHVANVPGTNVTYYEFAITHLRKLAEDRLRRIIASAT